ncbi:hypothetical protein F5877DRAFT_55051 [Lentinula edodes]|nr:hypothetical protein F5877DRAFT_55051 [Lentinula edodes]
MDFSLAIEIFDDDDPLDPKVLKTWIRNNKQLDAKNIPPDVTAYISRTKDIPPSVADLLPAKHMPVMEFLTVSLPSVRRDLVYPKASLWFSHEPQNCSDFSALLDQFIPSKSLVEDLLKAQDQAVLDGCLSIVDPDHPVQRFPLFLGTLLKTAHEAREAQADWRNCMDWLDEQSEVSASSEINIAKQNLQSLPWNAPLDLTFASTGSTTLHFSRFLSERWMSSNLVDLMVGHLSDRLEKDEGLDSQVTFEPLRFMEYLKHPEQHENALRRICWGLENKKRVLFVSHWQKKHHWIALKVVIDRGQVIYENNPTPKDILSRVTKWFSQKFNRKFEAVNPGNVLSHGTQNDFHSCGFLAVNAIEHEVWGNELWTPSTKVGYRVQWFNNLVGVFFKQVCQFIVKHCLFLLRVQHRMARSSHVLRVLNLLNPSPVIQSMDSTSAPVLVGSTVLSMGSLESQQTVEAPLSLSPFVSIPTNKRPRSPDASLSENEKLSVPPAPIFVEDNSDFVITDGSDEDNDSDSVASAATDDKFYATFNGPGVSKSAKWARKQNNIYESLKKNKDYDPANAKHRSSMRKLLIKVKRLDPHAEVVNPKTIRHSKCGKTHKLDAPFKLSNFRKHVQKHCNGKGNHAGAGCKTISNFFKPIPAKESAVVQLNTSTADKSSKIPNLPCAGLSEEDHPGIALLLDRTGALGGGAPSVTVLTRRLFQRKNFKTLSPKQKRKVKLLQRREWRWELHHDVGRVYSTSCTRTLDSGETGPCFPCISILHLKAFRTAIAVPKPALENYKFLNKEYLNGTLSTIFANSLGLHELVKKDPSKTPALKYALGVLDGKFADGKHNEFFGDLLKVMNLMQSKKERGVGTEGFPWSPLLTQVAQAVAMISPAAYDALRTFIPLPEIRTLQRQRAALPKFPVDIQPRTFELAKAHLDALNYKGPVALSCDDTKLQQALRPFFDEDRQSWCILGSAGTPMLVVDPEEFHNSIKSAKVEKASKLRLYSMQVCCPGVPSHILAVKAITNKLSVDELYEYSRIVIYGLLSVDILVCSYSCDGTVTERNVQHRLVESADSYHTHSIYDPRTGHSSIAFKIPVFAGQPIAIIQDDLHLSKTMRNNAFSGARLLVFPNSVVMYSQVREIALQEGPIYKRDVIKLDRQDDNAAARLFSASTIDWLASEERRSDQNIGLLVYLFVFGELVDAFQSRTVSITARVRMVLQAYFFLDIWETYLDVAGYPKSKYFLSRDSVDILRIHIFGISRKIDPDFSMYSWYILMPKIILMLRNAILSEQGKKGKACASGYNHSYLDRHGCDPAALSQFPTNQDIDDASKFAYADAVSLFELVGLAVDELKGSTSLPSISSWFNAPSPTFTSPSMVIATSKAIPDELQGSVDSESDSDESDDDDDGVLSLQAAVDRAENLEPTTHKERQKLMCYRFAAVALEIDKDMDINLLPEEDEQMHTENISNDIECIGEMIASTLAVPKHDDPTRPSFHTLDLMDLKHLYTIRKSHETRLAASATRQFSTTVGSKINGKERSQLTAEAKIKLGFQEIINQESKKDRGEGTGLNRTLRYTTAAKGGGEGQEGDDELNSGNTVNAAIVATTNAKTLLTRRRKAFESLPQSHLPSFLAFGRITELAPIRVDGTSASGYGLAVLGFSSTNSMDRSHLVVCRILSMYEKGGGKNGRHNYVDSSTNLCALSYLAVQIYEPTVASLFSPMRSNFSMALSFSQLTPSMFLSTLHDVPTLVNMRLRLSTRDRDTYQLISENMSDLRAVLKKLSNRKTKT